MSWKAKSILQRKDTAKNQSLKPLIKLKYEIQRAIKAPRNHQMRLYNRLYIELGLENNGILLLKGMSFESH